MEERVEKTEEIMHNCGFCVAHSLHDAYSFIRSLQHRGREAAGLAFIGENQIDVVKWTGPVDRFDLKDLYNIFQSPNYHTYMAHVRYATRGRKEPRQILQDGHPHVIGGKIYDRGNHIIITDCHVAGVHNGQINPEYLDGVDKSQLKTGCDTEALLHYFWENNEIGMMKKIPGAYTIAMTSRRRKEVIVLRDRTGIKPGVLGRKDGKYGVASEDVAFRKNGGDFIEDLEPGSVYYLSADGNYQKERIISPRLRHCFFEYNYIADVDSIMDGVSVRKVREGLGETLADEFHPSDVDFVTFMPRCPEVAARKYAEKIGLPFEYVFYKPRAERAFQGSTPEDRQQSIRDNLYLFHEIHGNNTQDFLRNKSLIVIDDSTIRGNNSRRAIELLNLAGVKKIFLLNYTPKIGIIGEDGIQRGCLYGVDMPPNDDFVVRHKKTRNLTDEEISRRIGTNVSFLSLEKMLKSFERAGMHSGNLCTFCIGGKKPF